MTPVPLRGWPYGDKRSPRQLLESLGVDTGTPEQTARTLPFAGGDATCGCENELQAVVIGSAEDVDLPRRIRESNYFHNIIKRCRRGDVSCRVVSGLEDWLEDNPRLVWENSWVRLRHELLSPIARQVWETDLLTQKSDPASGRRSDAERYELNGKDGRVIRIPVSYLLKLALVDVMGSQPDLAPEFRNRGLAMAEHFLSDNTSPETYSFYTANLTKENGMGRAVSDETCLRYLLTQLLTQYSEESLGLKESGQRVSAYFAPHPPIRQKKLNECISDAFYRELFMNPCLSGWDKGEEKKQYMHLCHQVLSRAQFNALGRLKEAGIILNGLVVPPSASNISLANNGTHISLGSKMLDRAYRDETSGFGPAHEKYLGDLVTKITEHFLPLFVGTYSAAPFRLGFADFHPELVLNFLPFELDYTHLRMIWRRWRKKAHLKVRPFGFRLTPFGPSWLDKPLAGLFRLKGDYIPDYRLIDYMVAVMSTDRSPALDGSLGNHERLKHDLGHLGMFDSRMPLYMLFRQRLFDQNGFSGFEGRYYSLFESLENDLGPASELQCLITSLAYKLIATGRVTHAHIPDDPECESERRQVFFGAAVGLPTFFVREDTGNYFLREILDHTKESRPSRRYHGFVRIKHREYRLAVARYLQKEARELIESQGLEETMTDLFRRLEEPEETSAAGRITRGLIDKLNARDPLDTPAEQFNRAAEDYYRDDLRRRHLDESWAAFMRCLAGSGGLSFGPSAQSPQEFANAVRPALQNGRASKEEIVKTINLLVGVISLQGNKAPAGNKEIFLGTGVSHGDSLSPIHRSA